MKMNDVVRFHTFAEGHEREGALYQSSQAQGSDLYRCLICAGDGCEVCDGTGTVHDDLVLHAGMRYELLAKADAILNLPSKTPYLKRMEKSIREFLSGNYGNDGPDPDNSMASPLLSIRDCMAFVLDGKEDSIDLNRYIRAHDYYFDHLSITQGGITQCADIAQEFIPQDDCLKLLYDLASKIECMSPEQWKDLAVKLAEAA